MSTQFPIVLTCPSGAEKLVAEEAASLGIRGKAVLENGRVRFPRVSLKDITLLTLWHRTSERVWVVATEFHAKHRSELDGGAREMGLGRFVAKGAKVRLRVDAHKSRLHHSGAIIEWFAEATKVVPVKEEAPIPPEGVTASLKHTPTLAIRLNRDICEVWVDARGPSKGRRGWREHTGAAPLAEPAAAAVLRAIGWKPGETLVDPCCGSGTLVIEAARQTMGAPVLAHRDPACMAWPMMEGGTIAAARHAAPKPVLPEPGASTLATFRGSDEAEAEVRAARHNAERAGVTDITLFQTADAREVSFGDGPGWIVSNPPWGERLPNLDLFRTIFGARLKGMDAGWKVAIVEPSPEHAQKLLGKCHEVLRIRCGGIPAGVYVKG